MIEFFWHRRQDRRGVVWQLWSKYSADHLGTCLYLSGSKRWQVSASAPTKAGRVLCTHQAGTAAAARRALERDWCKRSIGLFGEDDIVFHELT